MSSLNYYYNLLKSARRRRRLKSLDTILVVDLEATTYVDRPRDAIRDVIEVGICELRMDSGKIKRATSVIVRPTSSEVTPFCTQLTGISPEKAAAGMTFVDACEWLKAEYKSEEHVWASFGDFDRAQFVTQCEREGLDYPWPPSHLDIKLLAALRFDWKRGKSLTRSLSALGLKMEGRHHSARDDATNAAQILHKVLRG